MTKVSLYDDIFGHRSLFGGHLEASGGQPIAPSVGMLNAVRRAILLSSTIILSVGAVTADASPLVAGSFITVQNGPGDTRGGEFTVVVDPITSFITFCLQQTEYINFGDAFHVDAVSAYAVTDPTSRGGNSSGEDYISPQTAYLYTAFRALTLAGYDYDGSNRAASADDLQNAFWMFEQEIAMDLSNPFVALANTAVGNGWSGIGNVRVMNLSRDGNEAQDQLMLEPGRDITAVPEPASLILFGTGTAMATLARRRKRRQAAKNT